MLYDLSHLTGPDNQSVLGPIQDDEALFLYSVVKGLRLSRILEVGGLSGYSALNFIKAMDRDGTLYTVDINPVRTLSNNHKFIHKDCATITADDIENLPLDMIFFDCHVYDSQMSLFKNLFESGMIHDKTIIALHDTNVHPVKTVDTAYTLDGNTWIHKPEERMMVNDFKNMGYDIFSLHPDISRHNALFPFRHGVTLCQKFNKLIT